MPFFTYTPGETLELPSATAPFIKRLARLSREAVLGPNKRAEAAAIATLLNEGSITHEEVLALLLEMNFYSREGVKNQKSLYTFLYPCEAIWDSLTCLVEGNEPPDECWLTDVPPENSDNWLSECASTAREYAENVWRAIAYLCNRKMISVNEFLEQVPEALKAEFIGSVTESALDSPYGAGYTLARHGRFGTGGDIQFVSVLATTVLAAKDLFAAAADSDESRAIYKTHLIFLWMMIKGVAGYAIEQSAGGVEFVKNLAQQPDIAGLLIRALTEGHKEYLLHGNPSFYWRKPSSEQSSRIDGIPLQTLLGRLQVRLLAAQPDAPQS